MVGCHGEALKLRPGGAAYGFPCQLPALWVPIPPPLLLPSPETPNREGSFETASQRAGLLVTHTTLLPYFSCKLPSLSMHFHGIHPTPNLCPPNTC